jgi:hypothetical protein
MAQVIPEDSSYSDPNDFNTQVREYVRLKESIAHMDARSKELRDVIFNAIDNDGQEESSGSISLYLDSEVDGVIRLEKQRRATRKINELVADEIIEQEGLQDELYEMKRVINEDALMAALYEGKITEEQLDAMFPATVTWALRTLKK